MSQRTLAALILLNAALLAGLVVTSLTPPKAHGQLGGPQLRQYMMISGEISGRPQQDGLYFIDRRSGRLIGWTYDSRNQQFQLMQRGRMIPQDVQRGGGGNR